MPRPSLDQIAMRRALAAVRKAYRDSEQFDQGLQPHEIMNAIERELREQFTTERRP